MLVVSGDWNAKVGEDAFKNWKGICSGRYCNAETNERGLRLLKFAYYNVGVLANTLGTKHLEDGHGTAQMENTLTGLIITWLGGAS